MKRSNTRISGKEVMRLSEMIAAQSEKYGMGTVISSKVFGERAEEALKAAEEEAARLERVLSRFIPESDISRINGSAGSGCEKVSSETYEVLSKAVEFSKCCKGCFDVTIAPLVDLWRCFKETSKTPDESEIRQVLPLVDYTGMILDPCENTVCLKKAGQSIDLGGIGKGYAADLVLEVFKKYEVSSAFTNFGGNVAAMGTKPDGSPWRIGIRHPRKRNSLIGAVSVADKSVVTSGDYQRYFIGSDSKRYHHILDPATGYPAESGLISATVVAGSSLYADAMSTVLFVAGMNKGIGFLESFPGINAVLVDTSLTVYITRGLKDYFRSEEGIRTNIIDI